MYVKRVAITRISRRNNKRLPFRRKADVTNKPLVKNSVDSLAIVRPTFRQSLQLRALGLSECHVINMPQISNHPRRSVTKGEKYASTTAPAGYLSARLDRLCTERRHSEVAIRRSIFSSRISEHRPRDHGRTHLRCRRRAG